MSRTILTVNGHALPVKAAASARLLDVLLNEPGLKGTRFGCGTGHCGACRMLVDGRLVMSCDTPMWLSKALLRESPNPTGQQVRQAPTTSCAVAVLTTGSCAPC